MLVRSYRTFSPLPPAQTAQVAVCFLWHCPAGCPGLPLTITLLCEVRTLLEFLRGRPANSSAQITVPLRTWHRCRQPDICCEPRTWSMPATPSRSRSTTSLPPPDCPGHTSP